MEAKVTGKRVTGSLLPASSPLVAVNMVAVNMERISSVGEKACVLLACMLNPRLLCGISKRCISTQVCGELMKPRGHRDLMVFLHDRSSVMR